MYEDTGWRLALPTCRAALDALIPLGVLQPPAASYMTPDDLTREALVSVLEDLQGLFPAPWKWVTAVSLLPSQQIVAHRDQPLPAGLTRYHLPLLTNSGCWSYADRHWRHLILGTVYELDPAEEHGAVNWGSEVRVHLLIDCPTRGGGK